MAIHLVTLIGSHIDVLPCMLAHYQERGVTSFTINVHLSHNDDPVLGETRAVTDAFGCEISNVVVGDWQAYEGSILVTCMQHHPSDWWVIADQDELHHYPDSLTSSLAYCDSNGFDYVTGAIVDRFAEDGGLPPIDPSRPLWPQFPLGGMVWPQLFSEGLQTKVVAAKGHVLIKAGHHRGWSGTACPASEIFVQVHHFKWTQGLIDRQIKRAENFRQKQIAQWHECTRIVDYYRSHGGRMDVSDPRLLMAPCRPGYPHWDLVTRLVLARRSRCMSSATHIHDASAASIRAKP